MSSPSIYHRAQALAEANREFVPAAKQAAATCWTTTPVLFFSRQGEYAAGFRAEDPDALTLKAATLALLRLDSDRVIDAADYQTGEWVKVAESPVLAHGLEAMQLLPTREPTWWNHASPAAATVAGSLLGGAGGYAAGSLLDAAFGRRLPFKARKLLGYAGLGLGTLPGLGAYWQNVEGGVKHPWFDNSLRDRAAIDARNELGQTWQGAPRLDEEHFGKIAFDSFGEPEPPGRSPSPYDVRIDALGRTLWYDGGPAAQTTAAASMAAQRMPGGIGTGYITPGQFARFAAEAGGNAVVGGLAGAALGRLSGASGDALQKWRDAGILTSVVRTIAPRLFGFSG
jgi:hypothetical protein